MKSLRNQSGQMILESILIMTILLGITFMASKYMRDNEIIASLISGPWTRLSGMMQNGVWMDPKAGEVYHPNHAGRGASLLGKSPK